MKVIELPALIAAINDKKMHGIFQIYLDNTMTKNAGLIKCNAGAMAQSPYCHFY